MPRLRPTSAESGFAMILVLAFALIVTITASLVGAYVIQSLHNSRHEQDYVVALSAAESGVDDYLARLNNNTNYWQSVDCTNSALAGPGAGTNTCGWMSTTPAGWSVVADAKNPKGQSCSTTPTPAECPEFHYDVDTSQTATNGTITITSTGSIGPFSANGQSQGVTRTVQEVLKEQGFEDYLYFTNFEDIDPSSYTTNSTTISGCSEDHWQGRNETSGGCELVAFVTGDQINGPLHTNDTPLIVGSPSFSSTVETSDPACATKPYSATNCYWTDGQAASPNFAQNPTYAPVMQLPPSNSQLLQQVTTGESNGTPGCLYTGPTRIHFNGNGTMNVYSPDTTSVNSGCGTAPWQANTDQTVSVPNNNVIYVQNVPSSQKKPASTECAAGSIDGYPQSGDVLYASNPTEYNCRSGTVFVDGTLRGRVTLTADNSVVIVGNLTYSGGSGGTDSLGLISGTGNVEIYHPVSSASGSTYTNMNLPACTTHSPSNFCGTTIQSPTVDAAILSLNHSFTVQNVSLGAPLGTINLFGSIAQDFRGPTGTAAGGTVVSGYLKSYNWDTRLRYAPPPYLLKPSVTTWRSYTFAELPGQY